MAANQAPFGLGTTHQSVDLNANGQQDVVIYDFQSGVYTLLDPDLQVPAVTVTQQARASQFAPFGGFLDPGGVGDLNGDGALDLVIEWNGLFFVGGVFVMFGDGTGTFGAPQQLVQGLDKGAWARVGDFDGDGRDDLVAALRSSAGRPRLQVLLQDDQGNLMVAHTQSFGRMSELFVGDFDGDGRDDIAWLDGDELRVLPGTPGFTAAEVVVPVPSGLTGGLCRDFDGDGRDDLVLQRSVPWTLCAHWGNATGYLTPAQGTLSIPGHTLATSDGRAFLVY